MADPAINGAGGVTTPEAATSQHLDAAVVRAGQATGPAGSASPPRRGLGTMLRRLTGVDEEILARVPSERPRYTKLGAVILGTATVAAFSMWLALNEILGAVSFVAVVLALLWGLFILNLDSWLVTSMNGTRWRNRVWMVAPRLALAVLLGVLMAEPFVLWVFQTAIEDKVRDDRQAEVLRFQTTLRECNPVSGAEPPAELTRTGRCEGARVNVRLATPAALAVQAAELRRRRSVIRRDINEANREQARREEIARRECNGTSGPGLTGVFGVGPSCNRNRDEADRFREASRVATKTQQLIAIDRRAATIERKLRDRKQRYERAVQDAIQAKVNERRSHQREIGLLERLLALALLAGLHWHVAVAAILLRLVLITIDCLPIAVKLMGGTTSYDRLLDDRLATTERVFREEERTAELRQTARLQQVQYELEREGQAAREALDRELHLRRAGQDVKLDAEIDRLTEQLLGAEAPRQDASAGQGPVNLDLAAVALDSGVDEEPLDEALREVRDSPDAP